MPTKKYALEKEGAKRLEVSWKGFWKDITIRLDGNEIGTITHRKALKEGQEFSLPDGSVLKIQLVQKIMATELQVLKNGQPLPGSGSDPLQRLKLAYGMIFFIAGLNIILGLLVEFLQVEFLMQAGIGLGSVIFGILFLVLGFFVKRESIVALGIAVGLFVLDGVLSFIFTTEGGGSTTSGIIVRILFLIPMIRGFNVIRKLRGVKAVDDESKKGLSKKDKYLILLISLLILVILGGIVIYEITTDEDEEAGGYETKQEETHSPQSNEEVIRNTFEDYKSALSAGNKEGYLSLMTRDSQSMIRVSVSLMRAEYNDIGDWKYNIELNSNTSATVYFQGENRKAPPYFLLKENGQWKIDLKRMSETYWFDQNNEWYYR